MPTTHIWNGANATATGSLPYIYDRNYYTLAQPFAPGDTLFINSGTGGIGSVSGALAAMTTGTYDFAPNGGFADLVTDNMVLDAASVMAESGAGKMQWFLGDQFVNAGAIVIGSAAASGNVDALSSSPATLTNQGSITVQDSSTFQMQPIVITDAFVNSAGGLVSVNSGGLFFLSSIAGYGSGGPVNTTNNGVIEVNGYSGVVTSADFQGSYGGSGVLSVRGVPGDDANNASAEIAGPASGTFTVASGKLKFDTTPVGGTVAFLDNNGILYDNAGSYRYQPGNPFGATVLGFQAGDQIDVFGNFLTGLNTYGLSWNQGTHVLTMLESGASVAQFTLSGTYQQSDFHLQVRGDLDVTSPMVITTTSVANAVPAFVYRDTTTGVTGTQSGSPYNGPVGGLQTQFIWPISQDSANITALAPNVYLKGGDGNDALTAIAGNNVLDGGLGSNFLIGAPATGGGNDTFFLDGGQGVTWDTVAQFHPGDSMALWGFVPGQSGTYWGADEGAAGYTGATLHAAFAGAGTALNSSVTFAGISLATEQAHFAISSGSSGGRSYLFVHYNP